MKVFFVYYETVCFMYMKVSFVYMKNICLFYRKVFVLRTIIRKVFVLCIRKRLCCVYENVLCT